MGVQILDILGFQGATTKSGLQSCLHSTLLSNFPLIVLAIPFKLSFLTVLRFLNDDLIVTRTFLIIFI
ncbi:unnamed protein product, partial [Tenebrio molitor]